MDDRVIAQRTRLEAVAAGDGSLSAGEIESLFRGAIQLMRTWGAAPYEAHTRADFGAWLRAQDRGDEAVEIEDRAREVYERLRATRWLAMLEKQA